MKILQWSIVYIFSISMIFVSLGAAEEQSLLPKLEQVTTQYRSDNSGTLMPLDLIYDWIIEQLYNKDEDSKKILKSEGVRERILKRLKEHVRTKGTLRDILKFVVANAPKDLEVALVDKQHNEAFNSLGSSLLTSSRPTIHPVFPGVVVSPGLGDVHSVHMDVADRDSEEARLSRLNAQSYWDGPSPDGSRASSPAPRSEQLRDDRDSNILTQYNAFKPTEVQRKLTWKQWAGEKLGYQYFTPQEEELIAHGNLDKGTGYFFGVAGKPFGFMSVTLPFAIRSEEKGRRIDEFQKSDLISFYYSLFALFKRKGGIQLVLKLLNNTYSLTGDEKQATESRQLLNTLIGNPATRVLQEDSSLSGLDKMRIELLQKHFNTALIDELKKFLKKEYEQRMAIEQGADEKDENFAVRGAKEITNLQKKLKKEMRARLQKLDGVHTGIEEEDGYYGIDEQGKFGLSEVESLASAMERIESIPTSYAKMLKHAAVGAGVAAVAGGAYLYHQGHLDGAIETGSQWMADAVSTVQEKGALFAEKVAPFTSALTKAFGFGKSAVGYGMHEAGNFFNSMRSSFQNIKPTPAVDPSRADMFRPLR